MGSYNIALIWVGDPESIYIVKNSGDMAIAENTLTNEFFISSDADVLMKDFDCSNLVYLNDNEIVRIN